MKAILITLTTPFKDNLHGSTALPFHLLKERNDDIKVVIYSFNANRLSEDQIGKVERELNVEIHLLDLPWWYRWLLRYKLLFLRVLMQYPFVNYIKVPKKIIDKIKQQSNIIWVYGEELSRVVKQFPESKRVHTMPDCESLYYKRMLQQRFVQENKIRYWRNRIMWPKYRRMERRMEDDPSVRYHLVGQADVEEFTTINPQAQAHFIHHPHYDVAEPAKEIRFARPRIRLVVAGRHDLYMTQTADEVTDALCQAGDLQQHYVFTFLGKGWEYTAARLIRQGYEVSIIPFAPDYKAELVRHDIQVTPITIGTGTKGKVLDALANGLLVIGTPYAMENIAVTDGESCRTFETAQQCLEILRDIPDNIKRYEAIAEQGRQAVLLNHSRKAISEQFFNLFRL